MSTSTKGKGTVATTGQVLLAIAYDALKNTQYPLALRSLRAFTDWKDATPLARSRAMLEIAKSLLELSQPTNAVLDAFRQSVSENLFIFHVYSSFVDVVF